MLTVYPSNRLEDLSQLFQAVLNHRQGAILQADTVLVESQGMQHWLNLQLAEQQGVAMNLRFPMPSRFIWEIARDLLGSDKVPQQSPYRREVLAWRLDKLLCDESFASQPESEAVSRYWQGDLLKRFQLATRLADVYEQYMMFRPDWLEAWQRGERLELGQDEAWQAWLWQALVKQQPLHPVALQRQALELLKEQQQRPRHLPANLYVFAINTLAPMNLAFFEALAEHCDIHLFHLNPCEAYWGDQQSDRQLARQYRQNQIEQWLEGDERNPLLANLGQQGRDFFNLLHKPGTEFYEIAAFQDPLVQPGSAEAGEPSVLKRLQSDIHNLRDATETPTELRDDSIVVSSSHSALREIQALHDYLLHQFNDPSLDLKPQDVVVMCPAIEDYAPYVDAVFRRPWETQQAGETPRLACSIADRTLLDSEPVVAAFLSLLQLPDSRFELSKVFDYLRLPALQQRFGLQDSELETLQWWLSEAAVHWGLNQEHKQQQAELSSSSNMFSWEWGLQRLLQGYAYGDSAELLAEQVLLPHVEGQNSLLLGKLLQVLESLQTHSQALKRPRTAQQWQDYLLSLLEAMFQPEQNEQDAFAQIEQVIAGLCEHCAQAENQEQFSLEVVRHYLNHHFTRPDAGNHFMTGQVTFCSMMPMRSIPFKVIAILGLNDGQYPRQNVPIGFDLMASTPAKQGDRSRRGDDRYLFLEALISAREKLYLSYQGRHIRDNSERQPSLILRELSHYLEQGYAWQLSLEDAKLPGQWQAGCLRQQSLHPFSPHNYQAQQASFDPAWSRLLGRKQPRDNLIKLSEREGEQALSFEDLLRFYTDPLKSFAQSVLELRLESDLVSFDDAEPFAASGLTRYHLNQSLLEAKCAGADQQALLQSFKLGGLLPDSVVANAELEQAEQQSEAIYQAIAELGELTYLDCLVELAGSTLNCQVQQSAEGELVYYRASGRRAQDELQMYLQLLMASLAHGRDFAITGLFLEKAYNSELKQVKRVRLSVPDLVESAAELLAPWIATCHQGVSEPLLVHARIAQQLLAKRAAKEGDELSLDEAMQRAWQLCVNDAKNYARLAESPYFAWFYPLDYQLSEAEFARLLGLYLPLYQDLKAVK